MTALNGTLIRTADGWRWSDGTPEPRVRDLNASKHYNFRCGGGMVEVPIATAQREHDLSWVWQGWNEGKYRESLSGDHLGPKVITLTERYEDGDIPGISDPTIGATAKPTRADGSIVSPCPGRGFVGDGAHVVGLEMHVALGHSRRRVAHPGRDLREGGARRAVERVGGPRSSRVAERVGDDRLAVVEPGDAAGDTHGLGDRAADEPPPSRIDRWQSVDKPLWALGREPVESGCNGMTSNTRTGERS